MEIILAKNAGFCFGVQRAVDKAYQIAANAKTPVYTLGKLIHNDDVIADLKIKCNYN